MGSAGAEIPVLSDAVGQIQKDGALNMEGCNRNVLDTVGLQESNCCPAAIHRQAGRALLQHQEAHLQASAVPAGRSRAL